MLTKGEFERYHSLDAMRAVMMLLGLVLHSGATYTYAPLGEGWPLHDPPGSIVFSLLLAFIHLFRMPAFFLVAGFFAALLYYRDGPRAFARNRARRVGLPLVIFWATALPIAALGFLFAAGRLPTGVPPDVMRPRSLLYQPLGHLWFLYDLLLFYGAALVLVPVLARLSPAFRARASRLVALVAARTWGALMAGLLTAITLLPMQGPAIETSSSLLPPFRVLVAYGVFFAFGWAVFLQRETLIPQFAGSWRRHLALGLLLSVGYIVILLAQRRMAPLTWHVTGVTCAGLAIWFLIFGLLGLFVRYLEKPRRAVRYLSDASYWMYLTHLVPITWTAGVLGGIELPTFMKFTIVLGVTTLVTLATYHWWVRFTRLGVLLNGRRRGGRPSANAGPHQRAPVGDDG